MDGHDNFVDNRTDEEILANRATVQLYADKMNHIFKNVLDSDYLRLGRLFEAILIYTLSNGKQVSLDKDSDPITWGAFQTYKYELDADAARYLDRSRKRARSGYVGGKQPKAKKANASSASEDKQKKPSNGDGVGGGHGNGNSSKTIRNEYLDMEV